VQVQILGVGGVHELEEAEELLVAVLRECRAITEPLATS
jgi:hypothetical protein